jgi:hypothetical protein
MGATLQWPKASPYYHTAHCFVRFNRAAFHSLDASLLPFVVTVPPG